MVEKVDKPFAEYEKTIKLEKKYVDDHGLVHHGDGGEAPPPSPSSSGSSSCSSHHSRRHHRHTSKKSFLKLDVNFSCLCIQENVMRKNSKIGLDGLRSTAIINRSRKTRKRSSWHPFDWVAPLSFAGEQIARQQQSG